MGAWKHCGGKGEMEGQRGRNNKKGDGQVYRRVIYLDIRLD